MGVTISTHNGSSVARDHNIRNRKVTDKEEHIDPNGVHEIWHDEKPRDAYERIFGQAVEDYNEKQTRADRKITSYFNEVEKDAKKHTVYEMIIGVYGKNENGTPICPEETGKEIMRDFVDDWKQRNPNLELIGAYYHADEQGEPHVHIDYIPVAHGYSRGMETQNGLVKALGEMGFHKQGKATAQIQWEKRENDYLDRLCRDRGLEVEHPKEENVKHLDTATYKAEKHLESVIDYTNDLDNINVALKRDNDALTAEKERLTEEVTPYRKLKTGIEQVETKGKTILPGVVAVSKKNLAELKEQAKAYSVNRDEIDDIRVRMRNVESAEKRLEEKKIDLSAEQQILYRQQAEVRNMYNRQLQLNQLLEQSEKERDRYKAECTALKQENATLRDEIERVREMLTKRIESLKSTVRGAYESVTSVVKAVGMLKYDKTDGYKVHNLTPKQEKLIDGIADYGAYWARKDGFKDLAEDMEKHVGISKGIKDSIEPEHTRSHSHDGPSL